jgi:Ser/Thr protein kinase RdoA (MazF antagonist)
MLLSGSDSSGESDEEKEALLSGYESLRQFPREQLEWIPLLRGLRILSYAAWIARRWSDPSFPRLFPQFKDYNYWAEEVEALERILWNER